MLVFAGLELAACSRGQRGQRGRAVLLLTAAVTLATSNTGVGVLAGALAAPASLQPAGDLLLGCWALGSGRACSLLVLALTSSCSSLPPL
jgi:hypothetical protein